MKPPKNNQAPWEGNGVGSIMMSSLWVFFEWEMRFVGGINKNGHRFVTMPVVMFGCVGSLSSCDEVECASGFEPTDFLFVCHFLRFAFS